MINVTKPFLPPLEELYEHLKTVWKSGWISNEGSLIRELELKLKDIIGVKHLFICSNGTLPLHMSIRALNLSGEIITTPFSFVATVNSIIWEGCKPVFADISERSPNINPENIEKLINKKTQAIIATHVYGYPCDTNAIERVAKKYNLKVIYDGAHAFGCTYHGKSLLAFGDISTCSFHATKIFQMAEGGCVATNDDEIANRILLFRQHGMIKGNPISVGLNARNSELHAALGLSYLPYTSSIIQSVKEKWEYYKTKITHEHIDFFEILPNTENNYNYFPLLFKTENELLKTLSVFNNHDIFPRRYFYPCLTKLPYIEASSCPIAESTANRVLCLPLYYDLSRESQDLICNLLTKSFE